MNTIRLIKRQFSLGFATETGLPFFAGNTIRGALGRALDVMGSPAYEGMFKTESVESIPNPYTISVPYPARERYRAGERFLFSVTLFGDACDYDPEVTAAAGHMCKGKLEGCTFEGSELIYDRVWSDEGAQLIPDCGRLIVHFRTPAEILSGKEPVREISFYTLMDSLFGRICDIMGNYTDGELILPYTLTVRRPPIRAEYDLKPVHFKTNGQPVYGTVGTVIYTGHVTPYLPYIDLGSQLHVGKKTTRGCGEYSFEI